MPWNWQLPAWPTFTFDRALIAKQERQFLLNAGKNIAVLKTINSPQFNQFVVEVLTDEGLESSRIEGEKLDRASLQSSIQKHFGLRVGQKKEGEEEARMAAVLCNAYATYDAPLTRAMLWDWHGELFKGHAGIEDRGKYRTHREPMQIVSHRLDKAIVYFEAPPSKILSKTMAAYIKWFNTTRIAEPILSRAAIAHLYFESIHPFEDGNGRIGRVLVEKVLSQGIERPVLIAVSKVLEKRKKEYYAALERCNRTLQVDHWVLFFADVILQAQEESQQLLQFLVNKATILTKLSGQLNERQEKVLPRIFKEGPAGFTEGLSAENYIAITKTTRATATRDLADLVKKGVLVKTGELRHSRYWLTRATTLIEDGIDR